MLELLLVIVVAFLILSFVIGAIPSIVRLILLCVAIALTIRLVVVLLGS